MIDFLRNNPYVTRDEYMWKWTIPQILLASYDFTHVNYLSDKQMENRKKEKKTFDNPADFISALGLPQLN